jgi:glycosyltransferase involved in cell wall biosynthesis
MRVVVNQWSAIGHRTGVGHYTRELLRCLREQAGGDRVDAYPRDWLCWAGGHASAAALSVKEFVNRSRLLRRMPYLATLGVLPRALCRRLRGELRRRFKSRFSREHYDVYHEPNFIPLDTDLPTVVTLHDLSIVLHPEWHPARRVADHERRFYHRLGQCQHFLTVSDFVRRQVIRHLHLPAHRVTRVYNGVRPHLRPLPADETARRLRRLGVRPGYLLYVGTLEPRKNVLMLVKAYCSLPQRLRDQCPLLLAGHWGWKTEALREFYHGEARHRGVRHLDYVPDRLLPALYNGARALAYPSLYEGFGLPPVEMLACGGAVLASTADALVETVGGQAHLTDPHDPDGWRDALARAISDRDWTDFLRSGAGPAAAAYTWDRCAAETLQVYRRVCGDVLSARVADPAPETYRFATPAGRPTHAAN